jgi:rare lipoprotein A
MKKIFVLLFIFYSIQIATAKKIEYGIASYYGGFFNGKSTASGEIYSQNKLTAAHKTLPLGTVIKVTNENNNKSVFVKINDRGPYIKGRILDLSTKAAELLGYKHKGTTHVRIEVLEPENVPADLLSATQDIARQNGIAAADSTSNNGNLLLPIGKEVTTTNTEENSTTENDSSLPLQATINANSEGITNRGIYQVITRVDKNKSGFFGLQLGIFSDMSMLQEIIADIAAKYNQSHLVEPIDINGKTFYKLYIGQFQNRAYADALKSALTNKFCDATVVKYQ